MKIKTLTLTDFRAFPGPEPAPFELAGKNLLVYGENGAGKSSIFYALREFFSLKPTRRLSYYKNIFSELIQSAVCIQVQFDDGQAPAMWHLLPVTGVIEQFAANAITVDGQTLTEHHPAQYSGGSDQRVAQAALRRSCLDYRALLDTNYRHIDGEINLFDIAVTHLIHDFPYTVPGGSPKTVGELWLEAKKAIPYRHSKKSINIANNAASIFNAAFIQALTSLHPYVACLLNELIGAEVEIAPFVFNGITYNQAWERRLRGYNGCELKPQISFRTLPMSAPHNFLNEARLSALGLAIYLAGRLACTPQTSPEILKLLVLDDVLIGLDHSNRLPVLDVLEKYFSGWQTVLLTHDRFWYETVKFRAEVSGAWRTVELYENHDAEAKFAPRIEPGNFNIVKDYLKRADIHLTAGDLRASAVYARSAFEVLLKKFCHSKKIAITFSLEPHKLDTDVYYKAIKHWAETHQAGAAFLGLMNLFELYRNTVLNPGSHSTPTTLNSAEIKAAIRALYFISEVPNFGKTAFEVAENLLTKPALTDDERPIVAGYLRAAFMQKLRKYVQEKGISMPFTMNPEGLLAYDLWQAARPTLVTENAALVTNVETHRALYIDSLTRPIVLSLDKPFLQAALQSVKPWV